MQGPNETVYDEPNNESNSEPNQANEEKNAIPNEAEPNDSESIPSKRFLLRYDEFFKSSCIDFFTKHGFNVETELEIYKLPKRLDVLAINTNRKIPDNFTLLKYWNKHNLISYKSKNDKFRRKDIFDATIYLHGYLNNTPSARYENSSMSIFMNHGIPKYFQELKEYIHLTEPGVWKLDFNFYNIHLINLRDIQLSGLDRKFLANFSSDEKFYELIGLTNDERKEIDEVLPYMKLRATDPTVGQDIKEIIMKNEAVLDITDLARPVYEKGRMEGIEQGILKGTIEKAIETARLMRAKSYQVQDILDITGLSESELRENGII